MSARQQRIADLRRARDRMTRQIAALDPSLITDLARDDRDAVDGVGEQMAVVARRLVQCGSTHAETAEALHLPVSAITPLIAPRRTA